VRVTVCKVANVLYGTKRAKERQNAHSVPIKKPSMPSYFWLATQFYTLIAAQATIYSILQSTQAQATIYSIFHSQSCSSYNLFNFTIYSSSSYKAKHKTCDMRCIRGTKKKRTCAFMASNSFALSEKAMISVGHTKVKSFGLRTCTEGDG